MLNTLQYIMKTHKTSPSPRKHLKRSHNTRHNHNSTRYHKNHSAGHKHHHPTAPATTRNHDIGHVDNPLTQPRVETTHQDWTTNASLTSNATHPSPVENQYRTTPDHVYPSRPFSFANARPDDLRDPTNMNLHDLNSLHALQQEQANVRRVLKTPLTAFDEEASASTTTVTKATTTAPTTTRTTTRDIAEHQADQRDSLMAGVTPVHVDRLVAQIEAEQRARDRQRLSAKRMGGDNDNFDDHFMPSPQTGVTWGSGRDRWGNRQSTAQQRKQQRVLKHAQELFAGSIHTTLPTSNASRNKQIFAGLYDDNDKNRV